MGYRINRRGMAKPMEVMIRPVNIWPLAEALGILLAECPDDPGSLHQGMNRAEAAAVRDLAATWDDVTEIIPPGCLSADERVAEERAAVVDHLHRKMGEHRENGQRLSKHRMFEESTIRYSQANVCDDEAAFIAHGGHRKDSGG